VKWEGKEMEAPSVGSSRKWKEGVRAKWETAHRMD